MLHVNTFTKKDAYAYMLDRYGPDTATWPYIPGKQQRNPGVNRCSTASAGPSASPK